MHTIEFLTDNTYWGVYERSEYAVVNTCRGLKGVPIRKDGTVDRDDWRASGETIGEVAEELKRRKYYPVVEVIVDGICVQRGDACRESLA